MDPYSIWKYILARFRRQIPLDIEHCSPIALRHILLDIKTPASVLERIAHIYCDDEDIMRDLVRCPNLTETTLAFIALTASEEIKSFISGTRVMELVVMDDAAGALARSETALTAATGTKTSGAHTEKKKLNIMQQVQRMTTPQKMRLAMRGAKEARGLLIRESNKQISLAVLDNPRLTDGEIEAFAKSANLGEDVIRTIGMNSDWSKKYSVAVALVNNPKTPPGVSVPFVNRLTDKDLAIVEKSKNVTEAVRSAARGLIAKRKKTQGK
jgi:hypothetical protein